MSWRWSTPTFMNEERGGEGTERAEKEGSLKGKFAKENIIKGYISYWSVAICMAICMACPTTSTSFPTSHQWHGPLSCFPSCFFFPYLHRHSIPFSFFFFFLQWHMRIHLHPMVPLQLHAQTADQHHHQLVLHDRTASLPPASPMRRTKGVKTCDLSSLTLFLFPFLFLYFGCYNSTHLGPSEAASWFPYSSRNDDKRGWIVASMRSIADDLDFFNKGEGVDIAWFHSTLAKEGRQWERFFFLVVWLQWPGRQGLTLPFTVLSTSFVCCLFVVEVCIF